MRRVLVTDTSLEELHSSQHDLAIFGVGVESRCDFVLKRMHATGMKTGRILLLVFDDCSQSLKARVEALASRMGCDVVVESMSSDSLEGVDDLLDRVIGRDIPSSVLIDYSAMSRVWYSAMLFWFYRNVKDCQDLQLSMLYACGKYTKEIASKEVSIKTISAVPGCAGAVFRLTPTSVVFGLGFYGYASLCVSEQLEPDKIFTVSTIENPVRGFSVDEQPGNKELILPAEKNFKVPLESVRAAYQCFMDVSITCYARNEEVILVPMGPKPHVLAATLASLSDRRICTLRVRHDQYKSDIRPSGKIVATRVSFVDVPDVAESKIAKLLKRAK